MTTIDSHGHLVAPAELYAWKAQLISGRGFSDSVDPGLTDEQVERFALQNIAIMDSVGTDVQIISPRPFQMMHSEKPASIVHQWIQANNNTIARQVKRHPDRLQGMAGLPQVYGESPRTCLDELDRAVNELGMVGCLLNPDPGEGEGHTPPLGSEHWYPLYEKLVALDVPALIHAAGCRNGRESFHNHFITEEGIAVLSLVDSRVFQDFPTLKIIVGHGGGSIPYQIGRWRAGRLRPNATEPFDTSLRRLYFDTCLYNKESLELLFKICGADRCLFGTEKPGTGSARDPSTGQWLDDLKPVIESIDWLSAEDKQRIFEGNARHLFPRLSIPQLAGRQ